MLKSKIGSVNQVREQAAGSVISPGVGPSNDDVIIPMLRLPEKGSKRDKVPCLRSRAHYLEGWIGTSGSRSDKKG
jgi:hypothetical protein